MEHLLLSVHVLAGIVFVGGSAVATSAPPFTTPGELLRQKTQATWPTWEQLMTQSPSWHDYDGYQPNT